MGSRLPSGCGCSGDASEEISHLEVHAGLLRTGDVVLMRDPHFHGGQGRGASACARRKLREVRCAVLGRGSSHGSIASAFSGAADINRVGFAVVPGEFVPDSQLRTRLPTLALDRVYLLQAMLVGIRVWDLPRYLEELQADDIGGDAFVRRITCVRGSLRTAVVAAIDRLFGELLDVAYEDDSDNSSSEPNEDCRIPLPLECEDHGVMDCVISAELVIEALLRACILCKGDEYVQCTPSDFYACNGTRIKSVAFCPGFALGPVYALVD
eukprot:TRINITY_DN32461_c0_g1_i1.p1 TRINITY_DN32461_c0_g1~~TRINITY_DN32461_c0_g1_i1.p1  ORF type:complete len:268 (+),score=44.90 TRINITY_DN32461_c0_g1_i1:80-883(+)